ncbi:MAG: hypothetical protein IPK71_36635 [Myxococcales bacterium]|nr:hypothetical protein [Myxococcales bacterium]
MRVTTKELRTATLALLEHLDTIGQSELEIDDDYYWHVPMEDAYAPDRTPKELTLGQLSHDWDEVTALARGSKEPFGYALVWLAAVLRRVGERSRW